MLNEKGQTQARAGLRDRRLGDAKGEILVRLRLIRKVANFATDFL